MKFCENNNWKEYSKTKKRGARVVVGRGIRKISFVINLNKSKAIWKEPFRPINVGPILLIAYARSLRSVKTTNNVNKTDSNAIIKLLSLKSNKYLKYYIKYNY